jgi:N12 class adenine-specific DNA methylase
MSDDLDLDTLAADAGAKVTPPTLPSTQYSGVMAFKPEQKAEDWDAIAKAAGARVGAPKAEAPLDVEAAARAEGATIRRPEAHIGPAPTPHVKEGESVQFLHVDASGLPAAPRVAPPKADGPPLVNGRPVGDTRNVWDPVGAMQKIGASATAIKSTLDAGQVLWKSDHDRNAASAAIEGLFELTKPLMVTLGAAAPAHAAVGIAATMAAQKATYAFVKSNGGTDTDARLAGNIAALLAAGISSKKVIEAGNKGVEAALDAAKSAARPLALSAKLAYAGYGPGDIPGGRAVPFAADGPNGPSDVRTIVELFTEAPKGTPAADIDAIRRGFTGEPSPGHEFTAVGEEPPVPTSGPVAVEPEIKALERVLEEQDALRKAGAAKTDQLYAAAAQKLEGADATQAGQQPENDLGEHLGTDTPRVPATVAPADRSDRPVERGPASIPTVEQPESTLRGGELEASPQADLIERIVTAAHRPRPEVAPVTELKGTDGKWYRGNGFPVGVQMVDPVEKRTAGYSLLMPDGTRAGTIRPTADDVHADIQRAENANDQDFRQALREMPPERLQSQAEFWLKDKAPKAKTVETPAPEMGVGTTFNAEGKTWRVLKYQEHGKGTQLEQVGTTLAPTSGVMAPGRVTSRWVSDSELRVMLGEHAAATPKPAVDLVIQSLRPGAAPRTVTLPATSAPPAVLEQPKLAGAEIRHNTQNGGVEVKFASKPAQEVLEQLKAKGFKWAKGNKVWYKKIAAPGNTSAYLSEHDRLTKILQGIVGTAPVAAPLTASTEAPTVKEADVATSGTDAGQLPVAGGPAADAVRDGGEGALGAVPPASGSRVEPEGAGGVGHGDSSSRAPDGVPHAASDGGESGAARTPGATDVRESVAHGPTGATHDPGHAALDYQLTPERIAAIIGRGPLERARGNLEAVDLIKRLTAENRYATPDEQEILAKYVGWGASELAKFLSDYPDAGWSKNERAIWERIKTDLTADERKALERSTPNAHFTFDLYRPIWEALVNAGFTGGRILEPAVGTGHAFGYMPPDVRDASTLNAVEQEPFTAAIAHHLYPSARVQPVGYENARIARGTQDLVISNVPFGDFGVQDKHMPSLLTDPKQGGMIHNYFFGKALEHVRPGGLIVFVTSKGTMDAAVTTRIRSYLMERAAFVGAIRLPNTAFGKSAKTEVITDLIVLRRLLPGETPDPVQSKLFIEAPKHEGLTKSVYSRGRTQDSTITRSSWYTAHPEYILGTESREGTMYGGGEYTVTATTPNVTEAMANALKTLLPQGTYVPAVREMAVRSTAVAEGAFKAGELRVNPQTGNIDRVGPTGEISDATPMRLIKETGEKIVDTKAVHRIKGMIAIRDALRATVAAMQNRESTDKEIKDHQRALRSLYQQFVQKHGELNSRKNRGLFKNDPESANLTGLEQLELQTKIEQKDGEPVLKIFYRVTGPADIFTKRVINPDPLITHVDTPEAALFASLGLHGRLDWPYMAEISGQDVEDLKAALLHAGIVFEQPDGAVVLGEEYLSGDVVSKLADAEAAHDPKFAPNIEALKAVQPAPKTADDVASGAVAIGLGSHWVPPSDLSAFAAEQLHLRGGVRYTVESTAALVTWTGGFSDSAVRASAQHPMAVRYGAGDDAETQPEVYGFLDLLNDALNLRTPDLGHYVREVDGSRHYVKEPKNTLAARANVEALRDAWTEFVYKHPAVIDALLEQYNARFNRTVERTLDGSHLTFPGMATITDAAGNVLHFFPHQKNVVWRILATGNTLMAHEVGAGKTYAMIAAAMEMRRTGRAQKPMITVPTYLLRQWASDIKTLYPAAKVLAFDEKDLEASKRREAMARIAFGNWDIVLVPHSSFELLKSSPERIKAVTQEWIDELIAAELANGDDESPSVKQMQRMRRKMEDKVAALTDSIDKGNDTNMYWDQLGVDALMVDEAHAFKNLFFHSKIDNMRGLSRSTADKSLDLLVKIRDINENSNYRNIVLATATPVMNSIGEVFTMQRYLQPQTLKKYGLENFDNWYAMFAHAKMVTEQRQDGTYHEVMRLASFSNLQTLSKMVREVMDYVGWEDMPYLKLPKIAGGKIEIVQTQPAPMYDRAREWFTERLAAIKANPPHIKRDGTYVAPERMDMLTGQGMGKHDNILTVMTDAKKAAIDLRLILGNRAKDTPGSRLQVAAKMMVEQYKATKAEKGVQLVFMDLGTPPNPGALEFLGKLKVDDETEGEANEQDLVEDALDATEAGGFNLYDALKALLVKQGVPSHEIAYLHQANSSAERIELFKAANNGRVRFVFASTDKGGVGMNVQTRLSAMWEIDPPRHGRPGDLRQRMGRIIRQGNTYPEVRLVRFVTQGTTDEWTWGITTTKDYQVRQFLKGNLSTMEDVDPNTMSLEEAMMRSSNDPRTVELTDLKSVLPRLEAQASSAARALGQAKTDIANSTERLGWLNRDLSQLEKWIEDSYQSKRKDGFELTIGDTTYTDRAEAQAAILKRLRPTPAMGDSFTHEAVIGRMGDRDITATWEIFKRKEPEWRDVQDEKTGKIQQKHFIVDKLYKRVALTMQGEDIGAINRSAVTLHQDDPDDYATFGKGQDPIASLVNAYESLPLHRNDLTAGIQQATEKISHAEATLNSPSSAVAKLTKTRERIAALEKELTAESAAKGAAASAALQAKALPAHADASNEQGFVSLEPLKPIADELVNLVDIARFVFAPDTRTPDTRAGAAVLSKAIAARDQTLARFQTAVEATERVMDGWSHDQSLAFWDAMEGVTPTSSLGDPDLIRMADALKTIVDYWTDQVTKRGLIKAYIEHYWPHEWVKRGTTLEKAIRAVFSRRPIQGPESYRKRRTIPTTREGIEKHNLEPVSWNPATQLMRKVAEMANSVKAYEMRKAFKRQGLLKFVGEGQRRKLIREKRIGQNWIPYPEAFVGTVYAPPTFITESGEEARVPFGRLVAGRYYGPPELVQLVKNHLSAGLVGKSKAFDLVRSASNLHTQALLGWSTFHLWLTGWESVTSKLTLALDQAQRGQFAAAGRTALEVGPHGVLADLVRGYKAVHEYYTLDLTGSGHALTDDLSLIIRGGGGVGWSRLEHMSAPNKLMRQGRAAAGALQRGDVGGALLHGAGAALVGPFAAIAAPTQLMMSTWVPYLKVAAYLQAARMELATMGTATIAQQDQRLREVWDSMDNRFGLLRYENLYWNNAFKDALMSVIRAVGFTGGSFREFGGAIPAQIGRTVKNAGGAKLPPIHPKMLHLISTLLVFMMLGAAWMKLTSGKWPKDRKDFFHPKNGEIDPSTGEERRDDVIGYLRTLQTWTHDAKGAALGSVQSLYTSLLEAIENQDYNRNQVWDPDDPWTKELLDAVKHVLSAATPIPIQNAERHAEPGATKLQRVAEALKTALKPTVPTPRWQLRSVAEDKIWEYLPPTPKTKQQEEDAEIRRQVRVAVQSATGSETIEHALETGNLTAKEYERIVKSVQFNWMQASFKKLNLMQALKVYELATPDERASLLGILLTKVDTGLKTAKPRDMDELSNRLNKIAGLPYTVESTAP